jgi:hypothetical protein
VRSLTLDFLTEIHQIYLEGMKGLARRSLPFLKDSQNDVLGKKLIRVRTPSLFLGKYREDALSPLRQSLEHLFPLP